MTLTTTSFLTNPADRIQSLDVMRGIVLFGILLMNINGMALGFAYNDPTLGGGQTGPDLYTWIMTNMLFEGTMRALFSLLFGVGMFIFLDSLEKKGAGIEAANIYFRRITWLLVFGLIHGYLLLWVGEILYDYAIMGFLIFSFRKLVPQKLIIIAVLLLCVGTTWNYFDYRGDVKFMKEVELVQQLKSESKPIPDSLQEADKKWEERITKRTPESISEYNAKMNKGYFDVVAFLEPTNTHFNEHDPYRDDVWDVLAMMLMGIALFKLKILTAEKSYGFYGLMALIGYGIGLSVNYYEVTTILHDHFSLLSFSKTKITYDLGRVPLAMGHVALIMLFCKSNVFSWLRTSLAAVGKMALTNYVMHSVFSMILFTGVGFGLFGKLSRHELLYVVVSIWIFQLIISPVWLRYFQFGPLEWGWRNLSYMKKHKLKKETATTAEA